MLKNANCVDSKTKEIISKIHGGCVTCKQFSKTPPKPIVTLPHACEFNEIMTMDLKEVRVLHYKYILHMIDAFTRLTVSVFLKDKRPETIVHHVMKN